MKAGSISFVWIMIAVMLILSSHKEEHLKVALGLILGIMVWILFKWDIGLCVCVSLLLCMNIKKPA